MNRHYEDNPLYEVFFLCIPSRSDYDICYFRSPQPARVENNLSQERVLQQN